MKIPEEHKLPFDFSVGGVCFRKGVALETVRLAAQRWYEAAHRPLPAKAKRKLRELISGITDANKHPPVES